MLFHCYFNKRQKYFFMPILQALFINKSLFAIYDNKQFFLVLVISFDD